ncbi:MAG: YbaB/EbfC family nucleoid-associated protein [Vampirovibrionales bacterium]
MMMFDLPKMIKQAQKLQEQMGKVQEELGDLEVTGEGAGGQVTILSNCKFEFKSVKIAEGLTGTALEQAILDALQDVGNKVAKTTEDKMSALTSGLNIPGLKLPF